MSITQAVDPDIEAARRRCRSLGHRWDDEYVPPFFTRTGAFMGARHVLHLLCETCGTVRHDACDTNGGVMTRRYEYPDGYCYTEEEERPSSDELRLWMIKRNRSLGVPVPSGPSKKKAASLPLSQQLKAAASG